MSAPIEAKPEPAPEAEEPAPVPAPLRKVKVVRFLAFVLVPLAFISFIGYSLFQTAPPDSLIGSKMPAFALPLLGSDKKLSNSDLEGQPVVLNFWASWCIPCREEAKVLEAAHAKYSPEGVKIIGVNVQDSVDDAQAFAEEFGLTYPIIRDADLNLETKLGVSGLPETFFVNSEGVFFGIGSGEKIDQSGGTKILGAIDAALLDSQIQLMLSERES